MLKAFMKKQQQQVFNEIEEKEMQGQQIPALKVLRQPKVAQGEYYGIIQNLTKEEGVPYRRGLADRLRLAIRVFVENEYDQSVQEELIWETFYLQEGKENHRYLKRFTALGLDLTKGFNTIELIGQCVHVGIVHNTDTEGNVYDNFSFVKLASL